jgi:DNA-3-methyladenine glycosylase
MVGIITKMVDSKEMAELEIDQVVKREPLPREFYLQDTLVVAQRLIGHILLHETPEGTTAGRIIETEAYLTGDPASHGVTKTTSRHRIRMGPPGYGYVYMIHGRWIFSVVCQREGIPEVVNIRAL